MTSRVLVVALVAMFFLLQIAFAQDKQAPPTRRDDVKETLHGVTVEDPYRWLEDQNSPETRAWIDQQNAYTKSKIGDLPTRQAISERLGQLLKVESTEAPIERNGRYFYRNRKADQDQYVIYMRTGLTGAPKVLVDPHPLSPDHSTSVDIVDVTEDGSMLAYNVRKGGADEEEVHFLNVDTGKEVPDQLPAARYFAVSILPDKSGFYYDIMEEKGPRVRWHKFGTEVKQDAEIFGKAYGAEVITYSTVSEDGHYLLTHVLYGSSADKVEVWFKD